MASPAVALQPLTCPRCAGPVPLGDADVVPCPYCHGEVPVPAPHRALERAQEALTRDRADAERLYRRLGRAPPRALALFRFFDSPWFWMFGAGFWIVAGLVLFVFATPWVGAAVFHVNTYDLLTEKQESAISIGGTFGSILLGLLLAGWSRKRSVSRMGLQVALAAAPPRSAGGPARCRRCGAALAVAKGTLGVRCPYCQADNLVAIPPAWIAATRHLDRSISSEANAALVAEADARRSLRWSLFWRLLIGLVLLSLPLGLIVQPDHALHDPDPKPYADPNTLDLGPWSAQNVPTWSCDRMRFPLGLSRCRRGSCEGARLVELRGRRPYRVRINGAPPETQVVLEAHRTDFFDVRWAEVGRARLANGVATVVPPLSGWYRVRIQGGSTPARIGWCGTQKASLPRALK